MTRLILQTVAAVSLTLAGMSLTAGAAPRAAITIQAEDLPVSDAVALIAAQAGTPGQPVEYIFEGGVDAARTVTVNLSQVSFEEALRTVLDQVGMTYEVDTHGVYRLRARRSAGFPGPAAAIISVDAKRPAVADVRLVRIPLRYLDPADVAAWFGGIVLQPRFTPGFGMTGSGRGGFPNGFGAGQPGGMPNAGRGLPGFGTARGNPGGDPGGGGGSGPF